MSLTIEAYLRARREGIALFADRKGLVWATLPEGLDVAPAWLKAAKESDVTDFILIVRLGSAMIRRGCDPAQLRTIANLTRERMN